MEEITISQAEVLTSPNPFAIIVSYKPSGGANLTAASWWTYVSNRPAMVAVSLSQKGFAGECITQYGTFTLCVPDRALAEQAFYCGTVSGRVEDKAAVSKIALRQWKEGFPPVVENSQVAMLCRLERAVPAGDHTLYIAQVEQVLADSSKQGLKAYDGYRRLE